MPKAPKTDGKVDHGVAGDSKRESRKSQKSATTGAASWTQQEEESCDVVADMSRDAGSSTSIEHSGVPAGAVVTTKASSALEDRLSHLESQIGRICDYMESTIENDNGDTCQSEQGEVSQDGDRPMEIGQGAQSQTDMEPGEISEPVTKRHKAIFADIAKEFKLDDSDVAPLSEGLMEFITKCMRKRQSEDALAILKDKAKAYAKPGNCPDLSVPRVDDLIWDQLEKTTRAKDANWQAMQDNLLRGTTAVARAIDQLVQHDNSENMEIVRTLSDSIQFLGAVNVELCCKRREHIRPDLNVEYKRLCALTTPITDKLFGDNLAQQVKDIGDANKLKNRLSGGKTKPGNMRGRGNGMAGAMRGHPYRGGGPRSTWRGRGAGKPNSFRHFVYGRSHDYWDNRSSYNPAGASKNERAATQSHKRPHSHKD